MLWCIAFLILIRLVTEPFSLINGQKLRVSTYYYAKQEYITVGCVPSAGVAVVVVVSAGGVSAHVEGVYTSPPVDRHTPVKT